MELFREPRYRPSPIATLCLALLCASLFILSLLIERSLVLEPMGKQASLEIKRNDSTVQQITLPKNFPGELWSDPKLKTALRWFSPEEIWNGKLYQRERFKHFLNIQIISLSFLIFMIGILWLRYPWLWANYCSQKFLALFPRSKFLEKWLALTFYALFFLLLFQAIRFPEVYFRNFHLEKIFSMTNETFSSWILRYIKESALLFLAIVGAYFSFLRLFFKWRRFWFIPASLIAWFVLVIFVTLAPVFLNPLFHRFSPLPEGNLRMVLEKMLQDADIPIQKIYVMDASRSTQKLNAYFTGFGKTRRIVLYDNLIENLVDPGDFEDLSKIKSVMAHEIGHWKNHHIVKGLLLGLPVLFLAFAWLSWILNALMKTEFFARFPVPEILFLPVLMILLLLLSYIWCPVGNTVSRKFEREADQTALEISQDPQALIRMQQSLARKNRKDLLPNRIHVLTFASHPTTLERIAHAEQFMHSKSPPSP